MALRNPFASSIFSSDIQSLSLSLLDLPMSVKKVSLQSNPKTHPANSKHALFLQHVSLMSWTRGMMLVIMVCQSILSNCIYIILIHQSIYHISSNVSSAESWLARNIHIVEIDSRNQYHPDAGKRGKGNHLDPFHRRWNLAILSSSSYFIVRDGRLTGFKKFSANPRTAHNETHKCREKRF